MQNIHSSPNPAESILKKITAQTPVVKSDKVSKTSTYPLDWTCYIVLKNQDVYFSNIHVYSC